MNSNEQYLDNLLKSMGASSEPASSEPASAELTSSESAIMTAEEIEAMFAAAEKVANEEDTNAQTETNAQAEINVPESAMENNPAEGHTVESTQDLSQEEIEQLLAASEQFGKEELYTEDAKVTEADEGKAALADSAETEDLISLLGSLSDDAELSEIGELLEKSDNNEPVDIGLLNLSEDAGNGMEMEEEPMAEAGVLERAEESADLTEENGKRKRKKKAPKEKKMKKEKKRRKGEKTEEENSVIDDEVSGQEINAVESVAAADEEDIETKTKEEKKKGTFFSKLFSALTQEEETEETAVDENLAIMQELEAEDQKAEKKKQKKGKLFLKGKKQDEYPDDEEQEKNKKKGKVKKKASKPVKVKKAKGGEAEQFVAEARTARRISKKSIAVVVLFAATVFVAILFATSFFSDFIRIQNARAAFDRQDYITCYEEMYGMHLSEEEDNMFHHAEIVLKMQRRITIYEKYMKEDNELLALDSLMQAIAGYDEIYGKAQNYGAASEVAAIYSQVLGILEENYGLTQEEARAIALCDSNIDYTRYLTALSEGKSVSFDGSTGGVTLPETEIQDLLPAEEELQQSGFMD